MISSASRDIYISVSYFYSFYTFIILYHCEGKHNFPVFMACSGQFRHRFLKKKVHHQCNILHISPTKMSSLCVLNPSVVGDQGA